MKLTKTKKQKFFNTSYAGLRDQGFNMSEDFSCMYRSDNGRRCALGFLIPDDKYNQNIEGSGPGEVAHLIVGDDFDSDVVKFFEDLQVCHDESSSSEDMKWRLGKFAEEHNLTVPTDE